MLILSNNLKPCFFFVTKNFSFFSHIYYQWWPYLYLHPLMSHLKENTLWNFPKKKTPLGNEESTPNTTHRWVSSLYFIILIEFSHLIKYFHIFKTSYVIKRFFMKGNYSNNEKYLCTVVEHPSNLMHHCQSSTNHHHMRREIFQNISHLDSVQCSLSPLIKTLTKHQQILNKLPSYDTNC